MPVGLFREGIVDGDIPSSVVHRTEEKEGDREFYFGQHERDTDGHTGKDGHHGVDFDASAGEGPTYDLLNGEKAPDTEDGHGPATAEVGETIRVYFVNGGPNFTSAIHPIGNVWSRYYRDGDLLSDPLFSSELEPFADAQSE